jgi:hypothetical protein
VSTFLHRIKTTWGEAFNSSKPSAAGSGQQTTSPPTVENDAEKRKDAPSLSPKLPAGVDPDSLPEPGQTTKKRSKVRKRLRYLRTARELRLRDLGGFVYEIHRTGANQKVDQDACEKITRAKLTRLAEVDLELRALEERLGKKPESPVLRIAGLGGECSGCGEVYGADSRFCSRCGVRIGEKKLLTEGAERPAEPGTGSAARPNESGASHPEATKVHTTVSSDEKTEEYSSVAQRESTPDATEE